MEDYGKVSVIMPSYNSAVFISEAIRSVIAQSYQNWELLVIDDSSVDETPVIVQTFCGEDLRIRFFRNSSNKGTAYSRNKGIKEASGRFISFLDADDQWKKEKLQKQLNFMNTQNLPASFSSYDLMDENGRPLDKKVEALPYLDYNKLLKANYVGNLTGIYDSERIGKVFCPEIKKRQDWALWLEVAKRAGTLKALQESLALYRLRKGSISQNKLEMLRYNYLVYNKCLGYSVVKSLWRMGIFLKEQFFIKSKQAKSI